MEEISRDQAIRNLINIEWSVVESYKAVKESLSEDSGEDLLEILDESIADCYANIGSLEGLLSETDELASALLDSNDEVETEEEINTDQIEDEQTEDVEETVEVEEEPERELDSSVVDVESLSSEEEEELRAEIEDQ